MNNSILFLKSIRYSIQLVYRSSKLLILGYLISSLLGSTLGLLNTFSLKLLIDSVSIITLENNKLWIYITIYILIIIFQFGNSLLKGIIHTIILQKAEHQYDCDILEKMFSLPLSIIDSSVGKDMVADVNNTKQTAVNLIFQIINIVSLSYTFVLAFISLVNFNLLFTVLFLSLTIPGVILNKIFDQKVEDFRRKKAPDVRKFCYYRWMLTDAWPSTDVRMYDLTDPIKNRYDDEKRKYILENKKLHLFKTFSFLSTDMLQRMGEMMFMIYVIIGAINRQITIGDITLYIGFATAVSSSFSGILTIFVIGHTRVTKMMSRLFDFIKLNVPSLSKIYRPINEFKSIRFDNVYFKYPYTEKYVLKGVSFTLNRGDKLSIVGVNGSGKSTIIKLMLGLYEIDSGEIYINGHPISDYDISDVRKLFSVLFQNYVQYPLTLRENIALSYISKINDDLDITNALNKSGIYNEIKNKLNNSLDSYMTRSFDDYGTELSEGQWQKIALSRTYFKNSPVMIFDEPSASLDAESEESILQTIRSISQDKTSVMISHRMSSARNSTKIIVLDEGVVTETGTHDNLMNSGGLYSRLFNLQKSKYTTK